MTGDANNCEETAKKVICMKGIYGFMKAKFVITTLTLCTDGKFIVRDRL